MLYLDTETFSTTPLRGGTYAYTNNCEAMVVTWAVDDGPVYCWDTTPGTTMPPDLRKALDDPDQLVCAHSSMFDRNVLKYALGIDIPIERWRDTMVKALAHGLPGGLDILCGIFKLPVDQQKHKTGRSLIQLFCKPRPKNSKLRRATRLTHPVEWAAFLEYARADIVAMRILDKQIPDWNYSGEELALWHLDQKINDRGMAVDLDLAKAAIAAVETAKVGLAADTLAMTDGEVAAATQRDKLLIHIVKAYGIELPDMTKSTLERRIADPDLPSALRELLLVRLQSCTTSTSKYQALINGTLPNGRLCGTLQYNGAARTRRWAGRLFQPQNLPSKGLPPANEIEFGIEAIKAGGADLLFDNVMEITSAAIRGCIVAPEGKKLVVADLANIEGRIAAWLAGENWKLRAFEEFDEGAGPDLYKLAYARAFGVKSDAVTRENRAVGKIMELMLGYEGGVGAYLTGAATYDIDLDAMAAAAWGTIPPSVLEEAKGFLAWSDKTGRPTYGLSEKTFLVCDSLKRMWRAANPAISSYWRELRETAIIAVEHPGKTYDCRRLKIRRDGAWLKIKLPSGRYLCYPSPQVDADGALSYMGTNPYTRKWCRLRTYGGKLFENCIAGGTPVLTDRGWVDIRAVVGADRVWDGEEWVSQGGCVYSGNRVVVSAYGVEMTPEHRVLTTEGWRSASSCAGHNRFECRLPDGTEVRRGRREEVAVGGELPMRQDGNIGGCGLSEVGEAGGSYVLRLYAACIDWRSKYFTRHVGAPGVLGVALDAGQMPAAYTPSMGQLRRARHNSLRGGGRILCAFLGRHGADLLNRAINRTKGQLERILPGELRLEGPQGAGQQHPAEPPGRYADGRVDTNAGRRGVRCEAQHSGLPTGQGLASAESVRAVYDLLNCGPRNRFVVRGSDGLPLIVHNCCQSLAGDVMKAGMLAIEAEGYGTILTVHDEVVTEAPDTEAYSADGLGKLLATTPAWAPGLPLAASGFESYRYRKE